MASLVNKFSTASTVLGTAVANSGTFTVDYPTGTSQLSFNVGLSGTGTGHYMVVNSNDKWTAAASKMSVSFDASYITVTNSTGASLAAGTKVDLFFERVDGGPVVVISIPFKYAKLANGDIVTDFRPGIDGTIEHWSVVVTDPVTTASKAATLNLEVGTTNLTGGTIALTSANSTPLGAVIEAAAITAGNAITRDSKISVEASSVTTFIEGEGVILLRIRQGLPDAI